jgi:hypothetical protein
MDDFPCLYRNISRRPIEVRDGDVVVVLAAGATLRADKPDPELSRLERAGALSRHAAPPPDAPASGDETPRPIEPRRKATASRPAKARADKGA